MSTRKEWEASALNRANTSRKDNTVGTERTVITCMWCTTNSAEEMQEEALQALDAGSSGEIELDDMDLTGYKLQTLDERRRT